MHIGGIVLAGGRSRRMGVAKATLPFGSEMLLQRVVRIVGEVASPIVVVAAQNQTLPALPPKVSVAYDRRTDRGPLEAIAAGLHYLNEVEAVFITACDTPLITSAFIRRVAELLSSWDDAAVPVADGLPQPLSGVYRPRILPVVEQMLSENQLKVLDLLDRIQTRRIPAGELRVVDPALQSLRNLNTPADYEAALAIAGFVDENRTGLTDRP